MAIDFDRLGQIWVDHGVMEKLKARYLKQINEDAFWVQTLEKIYDAVGDPNYLMNSYEVEEFDEEPHVGVYVSTVFSMYPSGKYYTPWANSNVTAKEALKDEIWGEALEEELTKRNLYMTSGEGDPCDIFFCKPFTKEEWEFPTGYRLAKVMELIRDFNENVDMFIDNQEEEYQEHANEIIEELKTLIK